MVIMVTVDAHVHVYPCISGKRNEMLCTSEFYGKLRRGLKGEWRPGGKRGLIQFAPPSFHPNYVSPEMMLGYMEWANIDKAVLLQAPMYGDHNEYLSEIVKKFSNKFVSYGLVDPRDGEKALKYLNYIKEMGHVAVKLEVPDIPFWLDDEKYTAFWHTIQELDLICGVDLGWDPESNPYNYQIDRLEKVITKYSNITFIIMHLGVSYLTDLKQQYPFPILQKTLSLEQYHNVWFELSGLQEFCEDEKPPRNEYPFPRAQEIVQATVEKVGSEKMIWGSDFPGILPYCSYPQTVNLIKYYCDFLSEKEKKFILGENALKVYRFKV